MPATRRRCLQRAARRSSDRGASSGGWERRLARSAPHRIRRARVRVRLGGCGGRRLRCGPARGAAGPRAASSALRDRGWARGGDRSRRGGVATAPHRSVVRRRPRAARSGERGALFHRPLARSMPAGHRPAHGVDRAGGLGLGHSVRRPRRAGGGRAPHGQRVGAMVAGSCSCASHGARSHRALAWARASATAAARAARNGTNISPGEPCSGRGPGRPHRARALLATRHLASGACSCPDRRRAVGAHRAVPRAARRVAKRPPF